MHTPEDLRPDNLLQTATSRDDLMSIAFRSHMSRTQHQSHIDSSIHVQIPPRIVGQSTFDPEKICLTVYKVRPSNPHKFNPHPTKICLKSCKETIDLSERSCSRSICCGVGSWTWTIGVSSLKSNQVKPMLESWRNLWNMEVLRTKTSRFIQFDSRIHFFVMILRVFTLIVDVL